MEPGIFDSWSACQAQIKGYPNAKYKSYTSKEAAIEAYEGPYEERQKALNKTAHFIDKRLFKNEINFNSLSVDAACSGNPGLMEYRGVHTADGAEIFHAGPFHQGTNNIGEFLALVHVLALLDKQNDRQTPIYSDSRIAIGWVKKGKANTKLQRNRQNGKLFELIARAEKWLATHKIHNPILKWETKRWGEIPADFGRK